MKKTKQYRSPVMASIHETAEGLHTAGVVNKLTIAFDKGFANTGALLGTVHGQSG
jgi:hypothetical protein